MGHPSRRTHAGALLLGLWTAGCGGDECDIDDATRDLSGFGLQDCGLGPDGATSAVDKCAVDAHRAGTPFRALYEDGNGLEAIVLGDDGKHYLLRTDGGGAPITRAACGDASIERANDREHVVCDALGSFETVCE